MGADNSSDFARTNARQIYMGLKMQVCGDEFVGFIHQRLHMKNVFVTLKTKFNTYEIWTQT